MNLNHIFFTEFISRELLQFLGENTYSQVAVLVDEHTQEHCYPELKPYLPLHHLIQIPSGEVHKNLDTCQVIWEAMTEQAMDRRSLLINLGGGVIGDMGGFCAASYKRGIDFVQIPTTLLAQVDASVGGKLGVDFKGLKNHIGLFKEPRGVFIDTRFLETLPHEEFRSGWAEVIKHCLIADEAEWQWILDHLDPSKFPLNTSDDLKQYRAAIGRLVPHSVGIKSRIVEADPLEKGLRKVLNFGHTLGHALETHFLNSAKPLLHGEAIAIGMICESFISYRKGWLSEQALQAIQHYLSTLYPKVSIGTEELPQIIRLTLQDKKNEHQQVLGTLLEGIGHAIFNQPLEEEEMVESLGYYVNLP